MLFDIAAILFAYLCGSIASAIVVCRSLHLADPRTGGSNNPGATNVLRLHGKQAAALTLFGDIIKGIIPVLLAKSLALSDTTVAVCGLAAFAGHLFPVFFRFAGGKGVATLIGVLFALHWLSGLAFVAIWLAMAGVFRISSLSALTASFFTPIIGAFFLPLPYVIAQTIMVTLVFWRHRSNIHNLLSGKEEHIGSNR